MRSFPAGWGAVVWVFAAGAARAADESPPAAVAPFDATAARRHQEAWARHLRTTVERQNSLGMSLVLIPPGEFQMGSSPQQVDEALRQLETVPRQAPGEAERVRNEEQPRHRVVLSRPMRLGRTETTVGQFRRFVDATGYVTETERFGGGNSSKAEETDPVKRAALWHRPGYATTDDAPVTQITWVDMVEFCNWLSTREGLRPCYTRGAAGVWTRIGEADGYRLPTEAEWEFACRAGTTTHYGFGDDVRELDDHAWFNRTAEAGGRVGGRAVAQKKPNAFGLNDMHGNAWERCQDFHDPAWYAKSPTIDPQGPPTGAHRVVRGAGWHYYDLHCRSAYRNHYSPIARTANTGFRVACGL